MNRHLNVPSAWSQLAIFLGMFGAAFMVYGVVTAIVLKVNGFSIMSAASLDWSNPHVVTTFKWLQAFSSILIFLVPAYIFARIVFKGRYGYFLGFKPADKMSMYLLSVLALLFALPFVFWLGEMNQKIPMPQWMSGLEQDATRQMEAFLKFKTIGDVVVNVIIIALLPAIGEELCFRSVLQRVMIQLTRNVWGGILLTGFFFSALHFQFEGFIPRMFLGVTLGALYWYSGSIWTAILAHFVNNAVQVIAVSYAPRYINENPSMPLYAALVSIISLGAILYFFRKESKQSFAKVYEPESLHEGSSYIAGD